jgi:thymidylate synthase
MTETTKKVRDQDGKLNRFISSIKTKIRESGFEQRDDRFDRTTKSLPGHVAIIKEDVVLEWLRQQELLDKYEDDWNRMKPSLDKAIEWAKEDVNNRRLVVQNDLSQFNEVFPCFTTIQFVWSGREEFDCYAYLRSSDLMKLKDDCIFFAKVMEYFEKKVDKPVTKLGIIFGHVHYEL